MPIDVDRLELVKKAGSGKIIARCPACALDGSDLKGIHLVIYPDGRFGCAANQGDKKHRQEIFRLCGVVGRESQRPKPIPIVYEGW